MSGDVASKTFYVALNLHLKIGEYQILTFFFSRKQRCLRLMFLFSIQPFIALNVHPNLICWICMTFVCLIYLSQFCCYRFRFWRSLYNRYINNVHPKESIVDQVCSLNDHNDSLRDHIRFLEKVIVIRAYSLYLFIIVIVIFCSFDRRSLPLQ